MNGDPRLSSHLTVRQRQLLSLLSEGITDGEIARRMHLSERQVRREVSTLLRTYGCRNRFQLGAATSTALGAVPPDCPACSAGESSTHR